MYAISSKQPLIWPLSVVTEPPGFWWQYSILTLAFIFACLTAAMLFPVACIDLLKESIFCWNVGVEFEVQFAVLPLRVQLVWVCCASAPGTAIAVTKTATAIIANFTLFLRFMNLNHSDKRSISRAEEANNSTLLIKPMARANQEISLRVFPPAHLKHFHSSPRGCRSSRSGSRRFSGGSGTYCQSSAITSTIHAFGGSYSLKSVLPALVPEMTYEGMEVADGQAAGLAWESLIGGDCSEAERQQKRKALLDYCGQDTMGMVEKLSSILPGATSVG